MWFLQNPLLTGAGILIVLLGLFSGYKMIETSNLEVKIAGKDVEITHLTVEREALKKSVEGLNLQIGLAKQAQEALEAEMRSQNERNQKEGDIQKEIDNAKPEDNAPVAPVLRRALERL